jgi:alpha-D-glucose phosphate-specific phosphoglucomutase
VTIKFGTDGWRAVISDEFTFANVRSVAQAIADHVWSGASCEGPSPLLVVGFDTRFLSDRYAAEVSNVLAANGLRVRLSRSDCPTPALSQSVLSHQAAGGVMITASHNPPRYNGIKYKSSFGGSAMPQETNRIEQQLRENRAAGREPKVSDWTIEQGEWPAQPNGGEIARMDPMPRYLAHIRSLIDLPAIASAGLRVVIDPMYGAGRGYIRSLLKECGCPADEIHSEMNPGFGGLHPEPIGRNLQSLIDATRGHYDVGLATDGDADRIGAVDAHGTFVDPHTIFALSLRHLVEHKGWTGSVVKTVSTSQMVNRLAERYHLPVHETPVGFNYICDYMLKEPVLIGGEESGGISIRGHIPEGDGILMGLLLLEIVACERRPLHELVAALQREVGPFCYDRHDLRTRPFKKAELVDAMTSAPPSTLAGIPVRSVDQSDGVKFHLDGDAWLLVRPSGTEPVLRIYAEAATRQIVQTLLSEGAALAERHIPA